MAETKGFEPSRRFLAYSLSRGAPSTTRPRLRRRVYISRGAGTRADCRFDDSFLRHQSAPSGCQVKIKSDSVTVSPVPTNWRVRSPISIYMIPRYAPSGGVPT